MTFAEMKALARHHNACSEAMEAIEPMRSLRQFFAHPRAAKWASWYALDVVKARWPEAEAVIGKDAQWACRYARDVLHHPKPSAWRAA